tara:strand:+ start:6267 stop:7880 length:1614 start_codon:yes stop_codon:yes gene_type:complete
MDTEFDRSIQSETPKISEIVGHYNHIIERATIHGEVDKSLEDKFMNDYINDLTEQGYGHARGYFYLKDAFKISRHNEKILNYVMPPPPPSSHDIKKDPFTEEEWGDLKQRFDLAMEGTYASAYKNMRVRGEHGSDVYQKIKDTAWHVVQRLAYDNNKLGYSLNDTEALEDMLKMLFGDQMFLRNGGTEYPNGIGLTFDRGLVHEFGLDMNLINENMNVTFFKQIKDLKQFLGPKGFSASLQIGQNLDHSKPWDIVLKDIHKRGGNAWFAWRNNIEKGGFDLLLVQDTGTRIEEVDSIYLDDGTSVKPVHLTERKFLEAIAEPLAYDTLDSNLDTWDTLYWFGKDAGRSGMAPFPSLGMIPESLSPFKPDISRHRIKYYIDKFSKGTEKYKENDRTWSFFDTGFGKDFSDPGRLEMKLIWQPIWDDILQLEKGRNREARPDEIENIFRQRARELFRSRSDSRFRKYFSAHDVITLINGPNHFTKKVPIKNKQGTITGYEDKLIRYDEATMEDLRGTADPNMSFLNEDYKDNPTTGFWR